MTKDIKESRLNKEPILTKLNNMLDREMNDKVGKISLLSALGILNQRVEESYRLKEKTTTLREKFDNPYPTEKMDSGNPDLEDSERVVPIKSLVELFYDAMELLHTNHDLMNTELERIMDNVQ